jgi:peptidoglycan/LPS O-acetylase OafA/YrhL
LLFKNDFINKAYRPDIDGLRAISVLLVIFYHSEISIFSGGYFGVDVFFVISGFLITGIIVKESRTGSFSLIQFYERRIKRILPALFFVVSCCVPFAYFWLLSEEFDRFTKSIIAVSVFLSNFYFVFPIIFL